MADTMIGRASKRIDALIQAFAPITAAKRAGARQAMKLSGAWNASDRSARTWASRTSFEGSADASLVDELPTIRQRSRDLWRNNGLAHSSINSIADNIVGSGFVPRLRLPFKTLGISRTRAADLAVQADEIWRCWCRTADATNTQHFDEMQHLVISSRLVSGDVFLLPLMVEDARVQCRYRLKIEIVEADRVETPWSQGSVGERDIRAGVELGGRNQPIAYWILVDHPGDMSIIRRDSRIVRRVPAHSPLGRPNVLHVFERDRVGQNRGVPLLAPVLARFKDLDDYEEAEIVRAHVAACFAAFITTGDPLTSALRSATDTKLGQRIEELSPGIIERLAPGEEITFANPNSPNSAFDAFVRTVSRVITSALGVPYEVATRDFSKTTYSQARAAMLEARRAFQRRQRWLQHRMLDPIWRMLLEEAWLLGDFEAGGDFLERTDLWTRTMWVPPGWGWVDPQKEGAAQKLALDMGVITRSQIIQAHSGGNFEDVSRELAEEQELRKELGLQGAAPAPADQADDSEPDDDAEADDEGDDQADEDEAEADDEETQDEETDE
jgi:lambda family phage portal protein